MDFFLKKKYPQTAVMSLGPHSVHTHTALEEIPKTLQGKFSLSIQRHVKLFIHPMFPVWPNWAAALRVHTHVHDTQLIRQYTSVSLPDTWNVRLFVASACDSLRYRLKFMTECTIKREAATAKACLQATDLINDQTLMSMMATMPKVKKQKTKTDSI